MGFEMKKNLGFTSFEFYFVMAAIGFVVMIGIQRYLGLAEETNRYSFEIAARNFNAAVYNYHARWMMARKDQQNKFKLNIDGKDILFSARGWPLAVTNIDSDQISLSSCLSLWENFLQNPPKVSYKDGDPYGTRTYHLNLPKPDTCRFEFVSDKSKEFYLDYLPLSGDVIINIPPSVDKK